MPHAGDTIVFQFKEPAALKRYRIRSGNYEHPSDLLYDTSIEILPANRNIDPGDNAQAADGYLVVGHFDELGVGEGSLDYERFGLLTSVRLHIKSASKNWVIISEVS